MLTNASEGGKRFCSMISSPTVSKIGAQPSLTAFFGQLSQLGL